PSALENVLLTVGCGWFNTLTESIVTVTDAWSALLATVMVLAERTSPITRSSPPAKTAEEKRVRRSRASHGRGVNADMGRVSPVIKTSPPSARVRAFLDYFHTMSPPDARSDNRQ